VAEGRRQTSWCNPGTSYASSNDPRLHFGLGNGQQVDSIEVVWPDGFHERFPGGPTGQLLVLRKGEGEKKVP